MWGVEPKRIAAAFAATAAALATVTAHADDLPGAYGGHGVSFSYPAAWLHVPASFSVETGSKLWDESFGPQTPPTTTTDPATEPQQTVGRDLITVAAYRTNGVITKKTLPKYKLAFLYMVTSLTTRANGQVLSGPQRITMGGLPGYRFQTTARVDDSGVLESRLVFVFKGKTEYFLNCQHVQDGPLTAEIEGGCDQMMRSFKVSR
jgi:hypothetical protein